MLGPGSRSLIESAVPYTYREVRSSYGGAKAAQERDDIMFRWFARPLSFPIAWLALRLGLSPNHVTYLSLVLNLLGLALMASGIRSAMATGVGIILLALILDAADGNMARTAQRFSPLGEWLEGVGAYVLYACFHLAGGIGAALSLAREDAVTTAAWASAARLVGLGAIASISITLTVLVAAKFSLVFPEVGRERVVAKSGGGFYGLLFTLGRNLSFPSGLVLPASLVALLTRRYELLLGAYAATNVGILLVVMARCVNLARRSIRAHAP